MRLLSLLDKIDEARGDVNINDAAAAMQLSKCHFSRYFHERTGILFSTYLNYVRVSKSIDMIIDDRDMRLAEVANTCGFKTTRNFNRVFKAIVNINPKRVPDDYVFDHKKFLPKHLQNY